MKSTLKIPLKLLVIVFCLSLNVKLNAQDFNDYQPIHAQAPIPQEFIQSSTQKYERDTRRIDKDEARRTRKAKQQFYLENNFVIDQMLQSGNVLFNDPISVYVNQVADELLKNDATLRKTLRFYVVKSSSVNAFATDRGTIFITLGLISRLQNEAQLAFILSHEIVHYVNDHNLSSYVEFQEMDRKRGYKSNDYYEVLLKKSNYSKDLEIEADEEGLATYMKSNYNLDAVSTVFDLLAMAHAPFEDEVFEKSFIETKYFKIPQDYFLTEIDSIEAYEREDDELSTHPDTEVRKDTLRQSVMDGNNTGKQFFIIGKKEFDRIKKIALFDLCSVYLKDREYQAAVYHAFLLSKKYPNNKYLKRTTAYALYAFAQYRNEEREDEVEYDYEDTYGEGQQVYRILQKLKSEELNVLASAYAWELHKTYPEDKFIKKMMRDMVEDMVIYEIEEPENYFIKKGSPIDTATNAKIGIHAFSDYLEDELLQEIFQDGKDYKKQFKEQDDYYDSRTGEKEWNKKRKKIYKEGDALGLNRVVFVNPLYMKMDARKKNSMLYLESEQAQNSLRDMITESSKAVGLKTQILDNKDLTKKTNIETYNDIINLNLWIEELFDHEMEMVSSDYDKILPLAEKYNTSAFAVTGAMSMRIPKRMNLIRGALLLYGLVPPFTPYVAHSLVSPKYETMYFTFVFDVEKNKTIMEYSNLLDMKDNEGVVKANVYWAIQQMKNKPKKKDK